MIIEILICPKGACPLCWFFINLPKGGIEPPLPFRKRILSPPRLPVPPSGHYTSFWYIHAYEYFHDTNSLVPIYRGSAIWALYYFFHTFFLIAIERSEMNEGNDRKPFVGLLRGCTILIWNEKSIAFQKTLCKDEIRYFLNFFSILTWWIWTK